MINPDSSGIVSRGTIKKCLLFERLNDIIYCINRTVIYSTGITDLFNSYMSSSKYPLIPHTSFLPTTYYLLQTICPSLPAIYSHRLVKCPEYGWPGQSFQALSWLVSVVLRSIKTGYCCSQSVPGC